MLLGPAVKSAKRDQKGWCRRPCAFFFCFFFILSFARKWRRPGGREGWVSWSLQREVGPVDRAVVVLLVFVWMWMEVSVAVEARHHESCGRFFACFSFRLEDSGQLAVAAAAACSPLLLLCFSAPPIFLNTTSLLHSLMIPPRPTPH